MSVVVQPEVLGAEVRAPSPLADVDERTREILERRRGRNAVPLRRGWLVRRLLLLADVLGLLAAFALATAIYAHPGADTVAGGYEVFFFLISLPGWIVLAKLYGLYDRDEEYTSHSTVDEAMGVFHLLTVGTWGFFLASSATGLANPPLTRIALFWMLAISFVSLCRVLARTLARRSVAYLQNTIIVGAGDVGQLAARKLLSHPEYGINLVGFVDNEPRERRDDLAHLTLLGGPESLQELIPLLDVERVIVAFSNASHEETLDLIRTLNEFDVRIDIVPRLFEVIGANVGIHDVEGVPLLSVPPLRLSRSSQFLKRCVDVSLSAFALVVLSPLLAVVAVAIRLESRGPVFFRQVRMGAGERTFRIYKFRTMSADAEARKQDVAHLNMHVCDDPRMFKIPDDPRVTSVGRFLRRSSIDELPQLINVLKGEMSLVGPRPLILDEDCHVHEWARKRLSLRPGITGLWQVLGRSDIPFDEMTKLDYLYVTNWSLAEDLRLMFLTIPALLRPRKAF